LGGQAKVGDLLALDLHELTTKTGMSAKDAVQMRYFGHMT
jgi:hypothetical protein